MYSNFEESDSFACIKAGLCFHEATIRWELDTSVDLEDKLAVTAATNLGDIRAVTQARVQ